MLSESGRKGNVAGKRREISEDAKQYFGYVC